MSENESPGYRLFRVSRTISIPAHQLLALAPGELARLIFICERYERRKEKTMLFRCPECGHTVVYHDDVTRRQIDCPNCEAERTVDALPEDDDYQKRKTTLQLKREAVAALESRDEAGALLRCSARGCGWNNKTPDKQPGDPCDRDGCLGVYRLAADAPPPFDDVAVDAEKRARARHALKIADDAVEQKLAAIRDAPGMRCQMHGDFSGMFCPVCHPEEAARDLDKRVRGGAREVFTLRLVEQLLALHPRPDQAGVRELTTSAVVAAVEFGERRAAAPEHLRPAMFPTPEEFAERMMRCYDSAQVTLDPTGAWHLDAHKFREYVARTYALTVFGTRDPVAQKMCAASSPSPSKQQLLISQPFPAAPSSSLPFASAGTLYDHLCDVVDQTVARAERETFKKYLAAALVDYFDRKIDADVMQHARLVADELSQAVTLSDSLTIIARAILTVRDACLLARPDDASSPDVETNALARRADNVRVRAASLIEEFTGKFWSSRMRTSENVALGNRLDRLRASVLALRPEDC